MKIIKLDAIDSTNTFLKELCYGNSVDDFTIVITNNQTKGRGQMSTVWNSKIGKNLTFSIVTKFDDLSIDNQFYISKCISLAIYETLSAFLSVKIAIKWPNDILAEHQKICGVLIENSVKKSKINHSIIGIGLNVNQEKFENLPNATSMKLVSRTNFILDEVLEKLVDNIKRNVTLLKEKKLSLIDELYMKRLYMLNKPTMFKDAKQTIFMGKIVGVSTNGKLQVILENETIKEFTLKEIQLAKY